MEQDERTLEEQDRGSQISQIHYGNQWGSEYHSQITLRVQVEFLVLGQKEIWNLMLLQKPTFSFLMN